MFSLGAGAASSVDPEKERDPPPQPTLVYFPQNEIKLQSSESWAKAPPDLFDVFSHTSKTVDVSPKHLKSLNVTLENDVVLEKLIPPTNDDIEHLPPKEWVPTSAKESKALPAQVSPNSAHAKYPMLSNTAKVPDREVFAKHAKELVCDTEDGLRVVGRRKARHGHPAPSLHYFRKFWTCLDTMSAYWDTSLDNYYDAGASRSASPEKARGLKRLSIALGHKESLADAHHADNAKKRYKGRRTSTGSEMPEHFRIDAIRSFMEPIAWAFGCQIANPRRSPQLQIKQLCVPVSQASVVWRNPEDKNQSKRGIIEGPLIGIQCRPDTGFLRDSYAAAFDIGRELAGLFMLAQQRAREGKNKVIPGQGKWYTTTPRWGGGPGGEFGEAEGNTDGHSAPPKKQSISSPYPGARRKTEEEIWKELKPGPGLWEPRVTYFAVGKDRTVEIDTVYMISALYHHISILKLTVHPLYIEFLLTGQKPPVENPDTPWHYPHVQRSRWFDLLVAEDRVEAFRGIWGVMLYMMRPGLSQRPPQQRQKSEISHTFQFRKKSSTPHVKEIRSNSVAF